MNKTLLPPKAEVIPYQLKKHGDIRIDNYYWMKERLNPEVIDYLERENDYYDKMTENSSSFKKDLFNEMKGRIKQDDESVPYFYNGYWYITRFEKTNNIQYILEEKIPLLQKKKFYLIVIKWRKDLIFLDL